MITKEQVNEAQKLWGDGVVKIGALKDNRDECVSFASSFLDSKYAFESGTVLFNPQNVNLSNSELQKPKLSRTLLPVMKGYV